jgi:ribokinase
MPATQFGLICSTRQCIPILNETELGFLTGSELDEGDDPARLIETARSLAGDGKIVCVTLGKRGLLAVVKGEPLAIPGREVKAVDTTGAGDCFVGALASQLAGGKPVIGSARMPTPQPRSACNGWARAPSMPTAWKSARSSPHVVPAERRDL